MSTLRSCARLVPLLATLVAYAAQPARADRPTSGDPSVLSGRTLGRGQSVVVGWIGWPTLGAGVHLAPRSTFNVGVRLALAAGSPVAGLATAIGAQLALPLRLHLVGRERLDVALALEPSVVFGEGALAGQRGTFADDSALCAGSFAGLLAGLRASEAATVALGVGAEAYVLHVLDAVGPGTDLAGTALVSAGIEVLVARDTLLFAEVRGGLAFAPASLFDGHGIARLALGAAYAL
ncbi:MAG: hypothetical protein NZ898_16855 [Myxococcota bacterium]|nr:hypothetical protein [Myxococcota bacterium]MDW8364065.1 hypothetical protein [Myxococcales bacterium]